MHLKKNIYPTFLKFELKHYYVASNFDCFINLTLKMSIVLIIATAFSYFSKLKKSFYLIIFKINE